MKKVKISIIAAISRNRVIGNKGKIPWYLPEDLKHFKKTTLNHPIIMGRKTFESIGKPLKDRINIVITKKDIEIPGVKIFNSLEEAIEKISPYHQEIFIIGGGEIYKQIIDKADKLYLTIIDQEFNGDTFFPEYSKFKKIISEKKYRNNKFEYKFIELEK